jgi:prepilin-type N-terminal cleavage/methylation domain-containing protein
MKNRISSQKGVTLIELLAAITISAIVIGLVYGVLSSMLHNNEKAMSYNTVRQEANAVITQIRTLHQKGSLELCYENDETIYLDTIKTDRLASDGYRFQNVSIVQSSQTITGTGQCANIKSAAPVRVSFTLIDTNNNKFGIDTTLENLGEYKPDN